MDERTYLAIAKELHRLADRVESLQRRTDLTSQVLLHISNARVDLDRAVRVRRRRAARDCEGMTMKTVCMYCPAVIKDGPPQPVSHGICQPCFEKVHEDLERREREKQPPRPELAPTP